MTRSLFEKYKQRNIPNKFKISEIDAILKTEYLATEIEKNKIGSMHNDPYTNFDAIVKCYKIDNKDTLKNLFNKEEKNNFLQMIQFNQPELSTDLNEQDIINKNIQEGKLIVIFLASSDGKFVNYFNLLGHSEKIYSKLTVLMGLDKEDCKLENPLFREYLQALSETGYLED
ncbi:hypothetical protein [Bacillus cereus]|uniref:Uncharacterized protein n=1 Tax=Bacillus cereus TaxID=1396 RepID=A0AA44TES3_BACCE|nr:hypothetical protein [Bacillus cereus]PFN04462.1 hypothetical protein COJ55_21340 [Bacillus cereus]PFS01776.1 hypothetical protein COK38_10680 [Bacillus cereus]